MPIISPCLFIDVDTQVDFFDAKGRQKIRDADNIRQNLKLIVRHAKKKGWPILSPVEVYDPPKREKNVRLKFPVHCKRGTDGAKKISETRLHKQLVVPSKMTNSKKEIAMGSAKDVQKLFKKYDQVVFEKYGYDVFKNPNFLKLMKASGIKTCVVFGVALDFGLEALVLKLMKKGFHVYLPLDAIKPINEANRRLTLVELRKYGAEMWNTETVIEKT